jgi:inorganic pyrophosphatase
MKPLTIIIETPKGSAQKYDYDKKHKYFKLKKVLPAGMIFPFDFGFIPRTKGEDGDPLDIIVISELGSFAGCAMDVRIIGGIIAEQTEPGSETIRNDRFIGIPVESIFFREIESVMQLSAQVIQQLEDFFKNYNVAEGKRFEVKEWIGSEKAYNMIKD